MQENNKLFRIDALHFMYLYSRFISLLRKFTFRNACLPKVRILLNVSYHENVSVDFNVIRKDILCLHIFIMIRAKSCMHKKNVKYARKSTEVCIYMHEFNVLVVQI